MTQKSKNTLLWRLSPPTSDAADSYLFGTMHVRDARAFGWLPLAESRLLACETFAAEFDFSDFDPATMAAALALPTEKTLLEMLPSSARKSLNRLCDKQLRVPVETFERQHPMAVSSAITQAFLAKEHPVSLDETLWQTARAAGKTCTGIETFAEQIEIMGRIPLEAHLRNLAATLKNLDRFRRSLQKMAAWHQSGDLRQLARAARRDSKGMRRILIYERNALMAERLASMANSGRSVFCAIGAGHLAGEKGVLRLLKKRGFAVKPVPFSNPHPLATH